jgi:hypothetical protein
VTVPLCHSNEMQCNSLCFVCVLGLLPYFYRLGLNLFLDSTEVILLFNLRANAKLVVVHNKLHHAKQTAAILSTSLSTKMAVLMVTLQRILTRAPTKESQTRARCWTTHSAAALGCTWALCNTNEGTEGFHNTGFHNIMS